MTAEPQWIERFVLFSFSGPDGRSRVPEVFPRHHAYTMEFMTRRPGELLLTGPLAEPVAGQPGAMNVFTNRAAAEEFASADPLDPPEPAVLPWAAWSRPDRAKPSTMR